MRDQREREHGVGKTEQEHGDGHRQPLRLEPIGDRRVAFRASSWCVTPAGEVAVPQCAQNGTTSFGFLASFYGGAGHLPMILGKHGAGARESAPTSCEPSPISGVSESQVRLGENRTADAVRGRHRVLEMTIVK